MIPAGTMGMEGLREYGLRQRALEWVGIGLFVPLACLSAWRLVDATGGWLLPVALAAALVAWAMSDLLSGLVHWAFDTYGSVHTPFIGPAFIRPFREHHFDPLAITRHDFVETNGSNCLACSPLLVGASWMPLEATLLAGAQAVMLFTALGVLATNQCHKWAHMEPARVPAPVRWAQSAGLVLSPTHHKLHHTAPFDSHFCTSNGWLNEPLNRLLRAWR
jgi:plasmanylethanolamine desaturase